MTQEADIVQQLTGVLRREGSRPLDELGALIGNAATELRGSRRGGLSALLAGTTGKLVWPAVTRASGNDA